MGGFSDHMMGFSDHMMAKAQAEDDQQLRETALGLAVESFAETEYVVTADFITRAKEFAEYIREGK